MEDPGDPPDPAAVKTCFITNETEHEKLGDAVECNPNTDESEDEIQELKSKETIEQTNPSNQKLSKTDQVNNFSTIRETNQLGDSSSESIQGYIYDNGFFKKQSAIDETKPQPNSDDENVLSQMTDYKSLYLSAKKSLEAQNEIHVSRSKKYISESTTLRKTMKELEDSEHYYRQLYDAVSQELQELKAKYETLIDSEIPIVRQTKPYDKKCTKESCEDDDLNEKLKCKSCKRQVHYACSRLSPYQIEYFVRPRKYSLFVCENCTTIKTQSLLNVAIENPVDDPSSLNEELSNLQKSYSVLKNETSELKKSLDLKIDECDKLEISRKSLMDKIEDLEKMSTENNKEVQKHEEVLKVTSDKIKKNMESNDNVTNKKEETQNISIEKMIEDRLRKFEDKIDQVMTNKFTNICQNL